MVMSKHHALARDAILRLLRGLIIPYKSTLYVDANPERGTDGHRGRREAPFLTIQAAVDAAPEYTNIVCVDSRTGAAAVGFDENTQVGGVVTDKNFINILGGKLFGDRVLGGNIPITNSIASADNIFSGAGRGIAICGFDGVLPATIGDEEVIYLTGDGIYIIHLGIVNPIGTPGFRGIHLTGDDCHVRRSHLRLFDDDAVRLDGCLMTHIEETIIAGALNGIHLLTGCFGCVAEHNDIFVNTVGVLIDLGATFNHICAPRFHDNTADFTNNGGPTNALVDAHGESQILAGQTLEDDLKAIYDGIAALPGLNIFEGTVSANWNTAFATSLEGGEDLLGGASAQGPIPGITLLHSLKLDVSALTDGAKIHVKLFIKVNDNEKKIYDQEFTVPTTVGVETPPPDTDALWIVNGTVALHDDLRVEVYSDTNEDVAIAYTYVTGAILP